MSKNTLLINTRDRSEMNKLSGAIRQLKQLNLPLVFVRQGQDAKVVSHELQSDLQACGFSKEAYAAIPLVKKSLMSELSNRGLGIGIYLGQSPEVIGKASKSVKLATEKQATVSYRYAVLCNDCECVITESTKPLTKADADKKVKELKLRDKVEVFVGDGNINAIEYDTCILC